MATTEGLFCKVCGKTMAPTQFYTSKNKEKYPPDGKLDTCKRCMTMHVDNWDPETYKWILEEMDVPYMKRVWDDLLQKAIEDPRKAKKITGMTVIGKYLSSMKLNQYKDKHWADTEALEQKERDEAIYGMRARGMSDEEIETELAIDRSPPKPHNLAAAQEAAGISDYEAEDERFANSIDDELTEEDKMMLRLKWGSGYTWEQRVRMEQLYQDMMSSFDIQDASTKDTLIVICKTSLKMNELIDTGDIETAQKTQKMYTDLMKQTKLTAAQFKGESDDAVNCVGELVAICEKEGFIPRYYVSSPNDHVDRTIQDMQRYSRQLITEDLNLGNMIEAAVRDIEHDRALEAIIDTDDEMTDDEKMEAALFDEDDSELTDKEFAAFEKFKDDEASLDEEEEMMNDGVK